MKFKRNMVLPMFFGLLLTAFAIGVAQEPSQTNQTRQSESCCAGDSCPVKDSGSTSATSDCCCCSGGSCDLKKHEGDKKNHECCSSGESCDMKAKHDLKNHSDDASSCKARHNSKSKQKTN
jgi:hypothetical protein